MKAASAPRPATEHRVLVVGGAGRTSPIASLPQLFAEGDLLVVNDAATLPASIRAVTDAGSPVEVRLVGARDLRGPRARFTAALLGAGDHTTRTEDRAPPPPLVVGDRLVAGPVVLRIVRASAISPRLVDVEIGLVDRSTPALAEVMAALYRVGRPVQYAHVPAPLALWDVQNVWASRPWAVEMPSAGRALTASALFALRSRGVSLASVTHAAGLSATGDPAIDQRLPLPERFEVSEETARAARRARARGGRVIAVGTSVVRALESAARLAGSGPLRGASGLTDLRLGPGASPSLVDGLLTGIHEPGSSHFELLEAFASRGALDLALAISEREGLLGHELGDAWLVWNDRPRGERCSDRQSGIRLGDRVA